MLDKAAFPKRAPDAAPTPILFYFREGCAGTGCYRTKISDCTPNGDSTAGCEIAASYRSGNDVSVLSPFGARRNGQRCRSISRLHSGENSEPPWSHRSKWLLLERRVGVDLSGGLRWVTSSILSPSPKPSPRFPEGGGLASSI